MYSPISANENNPVYTDQVVPGNLRNVYYNNVNPYQLNQVERHIHQQQINMHTEYANQWKISQQFRTLQQESYTPSHIPFHSSVHTSQQGQLPLNRQFDHVYQPQMFTYHPNQLDQRPQLVQPEQHLQQNISLNQPTPSAVHMKEPGYRQISNKKKERKKNKNRHIYIPEQVSALEQIFTKTRYLTRGELNCLALRLNLHPYQVREWYQKRRYKEQKEGMVQSINRYTKLVRSGEDRSEIIALVQTITTNNVGNNDVSPMPNTQNSYLSNFTPTLDFPKTFNTNTNYMPNNENGISKQVSEHEPVIDNEDKEIYQKLNGSDINDPNNSITNFTVSENDVRLTSAPHDMSMVPSDQNFRQSSHFKEMQNIDPISEVEEIIKNIQENGQIENWYNEMVHLCQNISDTDLINLISNTSEGANNVSSTSLQHGIPSSTNQNTHLNNFSQPPNFQEMTNTNSAQMPIIENNTSSLHNIEISNPELLNLGDDLY